jgi:hypothetical protein
MFKTTLGVATLFLLAGLTAVVTAQQRPNRTSDQQVGVLLSRMDAGIAAFRVSFDHAIDRSRINGSRVEDDINQSVNDFRRAADRFRERARNRRAGAVDVEEMMSRAASIDRFMRENPLDAAADRDWQRPERISWKEAGLRRGGRASPSKRTGSSAQNRGTPAGRSVPGPR